MFDAEVRPHPDKHPSRVGCPRRCCPSIQLARARVVSSLAGCVRIDCARCIAVPLRCAASTRARRCQALTLPRPSHAPTLPRHLHSLLLFSSSPLLAPRCAPAASEHAEGRRPILMPRSCLFLQLKTAISLYGLRAVACHAGKLRGSERHACDVCCCCCCLTSAM